MNNYEIDIDYAKNKLDTLKHQRRLVEVGLMEITSGNNADNIVAFGNAAGQLFSQIDSDIEYYTQKIADKEADIARLAEMKERAIQEGVDV